MPFHNTTHKIYNISHNLSRKLEGYKRELNIGARGMGTSKRIRLDQTVNLNMFIPGIGKICPIKHYRKTFSLPKMLKCAKLLLSCEYVAVRLRD